MGIKVDPVPQDNQPETYMKRIMISLLLEFQDLDRLQKTRDVSPAFAVAISCTAVNILSNIAAEKLSLEALHCGLQQ